MIKQNEEPKAKEAFPKLMGEFVRIGMGMKTRAIGLFRHATVFQAKIQSIRLSIIPIQYTYQANRRR